MHRIFYITVFVIFALLMLALSWCVVKSSAAGAPKKYRLTLEAGWNLNRYVNQPENITIDDAIITIHSNTTPFLTVGQLASPGLVDYAREGKANMLANAPNTFRIRRLTPPRNNTVDVTLTPEQNFIGVAANIEHNPGLFAGIDVGFDVESEKQEFIIPLVLYQVTESETVTVSHDQYHYWRTVDPIGYLRVTRI